MEPVLSDSGVISQGNDGYMEAPVDYSQLRGRVTDYAEQEKLLKIKSENNNIKFLKVGDVIHFTINRQDKYKIPCKGHVRNVEDFHFVLYVQDLSFCWDSDQYFRRGMMVNMQSEDFKSRVETASKLRSEFIRRKESFLEQLKQLNNDIWTYNEQKMKLAAEYDIKINELQRQKQKALDNHREKKKANIKMRHKLMGKLDDMDEKLKFYRIERQEPLLDRWGMDHDTGLPMARRPQEELK